MHSNKYNFHKQASDFVKSYYQTTDGAISFSYRYISGLVNEGITIAKSLSLDLMDYQNVLVAIWFRYAGLDHVIDDRTDSARDILRDFFNTVSYPKEDRVIVENAISKVFDHEMAISKVENKSQ
jgi:hypothetical protein